MERKTIGSFIAVLRKAQGMTQRQLAEKLNVSDKTVSRWERDEGSPDLALIPILAEIFSVSCDELLRGERLPGERSEQDREKDEQGVGRNGKDFLQDKGREKAFKRIEAPAAGGQVKGMVKIRRDIF